MELAEENPPPESGFDAWGGGDQCRDDVVARHCICAWQLGSVLALPGLDSTCAGGRLIAGGILAAGVYRVGMGGRDCGPLTGGAT